MPLVFGERDANGPVEIDNVKVFQPATISGDLDGDWDVDGLDIAAFIDAHGTGNLQADLNGDGAVDAQDLEIFAAEYESAY